MPAMHFHLRWPDQAETRCYSPSLVIKDHFAPGTRYPLPVFMAHVRAALHTASERVRAALHTASERVRAKFGFACSMALDQLAQIEHIATRFEPHTEVEVLGFDE